MRERSPFYVVQRKGGKLSRMQLVMANLVLLEMVGGEFNPMSGGQNRLFPQRQLGCGSCGDGNERESKGQTGSELKPVLLIGVFGKKREFI